MTKRTHGYWRPAAVVAAGALMLSGCMQGGGNSAEVDESAFADPVVGEAPADSLDGVTLTYVSWGGEFQNGQMEAFGNPFGEVTGAEILDDGPTDAAQLRAQVESGNVAWDVVNASPMQNAAYCGELYEEINWDLIDTSQFPEGMPQGDCYIASLGYVYGMFYNADTYGDDAPQSWEDFFDTERFPGTRAIDGRPTPTAGTYEAALIADGVPEDELYPLDLERAVAKWDSISDSLTYWSSGAEQTQMIQGGQADIVFGWSGRIYEANQSGANFVPVWNEAFLQADSFSIAKGTQNLAAAHAFINYALGAEQQQAMAELTSYSPVNVNSEPDFSPEAQEFDVSRPEVIEQTAAADEQYWGENMEELSARWDEFLNS